MQQYLMLHGAAGWKRKRQKGMKEWEREKEATRGRKLDSRRARHKKLGGREGREEGMIGGGESYFITLQGYNNTARRASSTLTLTAIHTWSMTLRPTGRAHVGHESEQTAARQGASPIVLDCCYYTF